MMRRNFYIRMIDENALSKGKMAFVSGPRQVGKTTLARQLLDARGSGHYYFGDDPVFRRSWIRDPSSLVPDPVGNRPLIVLDELHKAPRWKNNLKSVYDRRGDRADFLVTGSARLDLFRRGGDSMVGRYFPFRLHPFSLGEIDGDPRDPDELPSLCSRKLSPHRKAFERLLEFGGFPEPFLERDRRFTTLWRRTRTERLVREDLRDLARVQEVALVETAAALLPERVGSLFSQQSLSEDLEVSPATVKRWMDWLSQIFFLYRVVPHARDLARSLKKKPKLYLWDWSEVPEAGPRFENLVAGHLQKAVHAWTDSGLGTFDLRFVRDKQKREVDFLVLRDQKPWMLLECRRSADPPSPHLKRFASLLGPRLVFQLVEESGAQEWFAIDDERRGQIVSADAFLALLP
jgi:uncharacterized protein